MAPALVALFLLAAVADWAAIVADRTTARRITKPLATALLLALAAVGGDMSGAARVWLVVAVGCCLVGDIALLGRAERSFLLGLAAFALGHLAYTVTALVVGVSWPRLALAFPFLAAVLVFQTATGMLPGARRRSGTTMMIAVAAYSLIISTMVVAATGTASWLAAVGAMTFAVSDSIIGYDRFVRPVRRADLPVMVTYHVGQLLLVLGLIAAA